MSITAAERRNATTRLGPHGSFPVSSSGAHVRAAWDLAGHAADPDAMRAKVRAFARRHGLTSILPKTAQKAITTPGYEDGNDSGEDDLHGMSRVGHLTQMAYEKASAADGEYGTVHRREVISHAQRHGLARHLPPAAHGFMHDHTMPHDHGDGNVSHTHPVVKALPAVGWTGGDQGASTSAVNYPEGSHVSAVLDAAFDLCMEADEGKPGQQFAQLIRFAAEHNLGRFLPERAVNAARAMDSGVLMGRVDDALGPNQTPPGDQTFAAGTPSAGASDTPTPASDFLGTTVESPEQDTGTPPGDISFPGDPKQREPASAPDSQVPGAMSRPLVSKAIEVPAGILITKAWMGDDGTCTVEGWVSTDAEDSEHEIVEPEAFLPSIDGYAARRMPLSSNHAMKSMPIGHGQQVALVRDGKILKAAKHPADPADFEAFPRTGTGVYGRFVVTEPQHAGAVRKGNIGGFSFVGSLTQYEPLDGGRRRLTQIDPWLESTLAAYPINSAAVVTTAKAKES